MNRKAPLVLAPATLLLALAACSDRRDTTDGAAADPVPATDPTVSPAGGAAATTGSPAAMSVTGDAGVAATPEERAALGVLNAINEHEIAAGRQALAKDVQGEVAGYAQMMTDQHSENRDQSTTLGADSAAADARAQQQKGEAELARLDALSGDAYARAYVDAMVKGHTEALAALDEKLLPAATTAAVRDHLNRTRAHVARHLEQAKGLATGR